MKKQQHTQISIAMYMLCSVLCSVLFYSILCCSVLPAVCSSSGCRSSSSSSSTFHNDRTLLFHYTVYFIFVILLFHFIHRLQCGTVNRTLNGYNNTNKIKNRQFHMNKNKHFLLLLLLLPSFFSFYFQNENFLLVVTIFRLMCAQYLYIVWVNELEIIAFVHSEYKIHTLSCIHIVCE